MARNSKAPRARTRLRRAHELGRYDRASIDAILDAMPLCHVGYVLDGAPVVTPTLQWREGDRVFWHGSSASRFLARAAGAQVCLTVSIFDGMVLARSAFNHSVNYRSVMLFGTATVIEDPTVKAQHLETFLEATFPGRWRELRPMSQQELKATAVLSMPIVEASAKVSAGMPSDEAGDYHWPVWAGVVPVTLVTGAPQDDGRLLPGIAVPDYVKRWRIG